MLWIISSVLVMVSIGLGLRVVQLMSGMTEKDVQLSLAQATQTAQANFIEKLQTPTAVPISKELFLNSIPSQVEPYAGPEFNKDWYSRLTVATSGSGLDDLTYNYSFSLPSSGYASLVFDFKEPQDLSSYDKIQLDITFNRQNNFYFDVNINDKRNDQNAYYTRKLSLADGENIAVTGEGIRRKITIEMDEIKRTIDTKKVVWMWLVVGNDSSEILKSDFTINKISFIKP